MTTFMNEDFLLTSDISKKLYHDYAANCPIIDYHNHLSAKDIYERRCFENLTQVWLEADHYKWRCMRVCGVPEYYVTGAASDYEKFMKFAEITPLLIGTPVYHWVHLELQRYFGIDTVLTSKTADAIWNQTAEMLKNPGFDAVSLLEKANAKILCTTDDPADDLEWHLNLAADTSLPFAVLPSFRPDRFLNIDQAGWGTAIQQLGDRYGAITDWDSLIAALKKSLDFFGQIGCKVTDHGFIQFRYATGNPAPIVTKALAGEILSEEEIAIYQGALLNVLGKEYWERNLTMQLHLGPIRNNSPKLFASFGADAGGDSIGAATDAFKLSAFLQHLDGQDCLPKTILYNLHPADNAMFATMAVNFASDGAKVQYGAAWWLHDHIRGISEQIDQLLETGAMARSVGMLTDSRALTSFVRHEYYRRILCDKLGTLVEKGLYPADMETLGMIVENVCWKNAVEYFGFEVK